MHYNYILPVDEYRIRPYRGFQLEIRAEKVFGAVAAGRGLAGGGVLEVWYNADLGRGRIQGLPVVFPIRGTWREWED